MFDYRYLYVMRRTSGRSWWARLTGQQELKIGIAKNVKQRREAIDKDLPGDVKVLLARRVPFARACEKALHKTFSDSRFRMKKAGKGAGATEWFYCSMAEEGLIVMWVEWYALRPYAITLFWLLLLGVLIYAIGAEAILEKIL